MKQRTRGRRRGGNAKLMRALAQVKPTRLDPAAPPSASWQPASYFTQQAQSRPASSPDASVRTVVGRRPGQARSPARPHRPHRLKLIAAVSSALATGAALVPALTLGGHASRPVEPARSDHHQLSDAPIRYQRLTVNRPWHGRIEYGVRGGVVYLTGFATVPAGRDTAITVLPPSIRPHDRLDIPIAATPIAVLTIQITPGGLVLLRPGPRVSQAGHIWLSGVSFPIGS